MPRLIAYRPRMWLDQAATVLALAACLGLPLALLHARAAAEILIACIDAGFLLHVWLTGDFSFLDRFFTRAAALWWLWLTACSALGSGGLLLGVLSVRLPLLAVALGDWLLCGQAGPRRQHLLWMVLAAAAAWIALQSWQQYVLGTNLFGQARWPDGALTGPFNKPRAGPAMILLLFPVLLPALAALLAGPGWWRRLAGLALAGFAVTTMVLIGQRMPVVLMVFGLAIACLKLPRLRPAIALSAVLGLALLAALPAVSPATQGKLVQHFAEQLRHFATSDYGLIYVRALTLAQLHPWLGLGYDGFRRGCGDFWAMHGIDWLGVPTADFNGGLRACNLHPHNYYLEALDNAGLPGLALFATMAGAALVRLGGRATASAQASPGLRAGLFVGALVAFWPVASTSSLTSMPNGGWVFLLAGFGFAAAYQNDQPAAAGHDARRAAGGNDRRHGPFVDPRRRREWR